MGDFKRDLKIGKKGEYTILDVLSVKEHIKGLKFNPAEKWEYEKLKDYDIEGLDKKGRRILFEVKNDIKSAKTGNIAIEYECRGVSSGVDRTKADFWVSIGSNEVFILKIDKLKELIKNEEYDRKVSGGDDMVAKMYLFKKDVIRRNSRIIPL